VLVLETRNGQIHRLYTVVNPDKLTDIARLVGSRGN
jgi:hypothetical protein